MFVPFNSLPATSQIWIYQSATPFTDEQTSIINSRLRTFTEHWQVHGNALKTSFSIVDNQFIILAAGDEASGCSIDSSVRVMKELGQALAMDFLDRRRIAFRENNSVVALTLPQVKERIADGSLTTSAPVYDISLTTLGEFSKGWPAPADKTWLKRFFTGTAVENNG